MSSVAKRVRYHVMPNHLFYTKLTSTIDESVVTLMTTHEHILHSDRVYKQGSQNISGSVEHHRRQETTKSIFERTQNSIFIIIV